MIKLMIVDDEMLMIDGMCAMLADLPDIEIVGKITDARFVLSMTRELRPDIVILDVLMQTGHGRKIAAALHHQSQKLGILGCSTSLSPRVIQEMLLAGSRGYITKSEPEGVLESAVRAVIRDDRVYLSPRTLEALADDSLKIDSLTSREREVLGFLCRDVIPKQVADKLGISVKTVYNHIERIRLKSGVNNMIQLYPVAVKEGLLEMPG